MSTTTDEKPTMELTRNPVDGTWGFICREHGIHRHGLTEPHAINVERKHVREDHPDQSILALDLSAAAQAYLQTLPAWSRKPQEPGVRAVWEALTGLKGVEADAYAAVVADSAPVTAAVVPF